jgi:orotidine-5'-phosphate decarboxylase
MTFEQLVEQIRRKKSYMCIGLDTDIHKIPKSLLSADYPVYEFNRQIVDATESFAIAYKPNIAFYESLGAAGWISLEMTMRYIREKYPDIFIIADAKRGDVGNTSRMYAAAFLENLDADAITVTPYMGEDSVAPFLEPKDKWVALLTLTSNPGASDFQMAELSSGGYKLFEQVILTSQKWADHKRIMYVVGATKADMFAKIRKIIPHHFLLVPGVGAQGGSLREVSKYGMNKYCGLIVNSSRNIIYAEVTDQFANAAGDAAAVLQTEMAGYLKDFGII